MPPKRSNFSARRTTNDIPAKPKATTNEQKRNQFLNHDISKEQFNELAKDMDVHDYVDEYESGPSSMMAADLDNADTKTRETAEAVLRDVARRTRTKGLADVEPEMCVSRPVEVPSTDVIRRRLSGWIWSSGLDQGRGATQLFIRRNSQKKHMAQFNALMESRYYVRTESVFSTGTLDDEKYDLDSFISLIRGNLRDILALLVLDGNRVTPTQLQLESLPSKTIATIWRSDDECCEVLVVVVFDVIAKKPVQLVKYRTHFYIPPSDD